MKFANLILLFFLITSCHPPKKPSNIEPGGDVAQITLKGNSIYQGELIAVRDSNIYMKSQNKFRPIRIADIESIEIPGYSTETGQRIGAALPSLLLQGVILMVASDVEETTWATIAGASMLATVGLYAIAGSPVSFSAPISEDDIKQIRLYCRYPQDLDIQQWNEIAKMINLK
jgi:hypothetical protein